jgi:WD40 repeat protein
LAVGDARGQVRVYRLENEQLRFENLLFAGVGGTSHVAWYRDSERLAVTTAGTLFVWRLTGPKADLLWRKQEFRHCYESAVSPDGKLLAVGGTLNGEQIHYLVRIFDAETGKTVDDVLTDKTVLRSWAWHPTQNRIITGWQDGRMRLWDVTERRVVWEHAVKNVGIGFGLRYDPTGKYLAWSLGQDHNTNVFILTIDRPDDPLRMIGAYSRPVWSLDGKKLWSFGGGLTAWNPETGALLQRLESFGSGDLLVHHPSAEQILAISSASTPIGKDDWSISWHDLENKASRSLLRTEPWQWSVAWNPDGKTIVTGGVDGRIRIWSADEGRLLGVLPEQRGRIRHLAFNHDGRRLASFTHGEDRIRRWDMTAQVELAACFNASVINDLDWSRDGRWIAASNNGSIALFDGETAHDAGRLNKIQAGRIVFSPTEAKIAALYSVVGKPGEHVGVWSIPDLKPIFTLALDPAEQRSGSLAWLASGDLLVGSQVVDATGAIRPSNNSKSTSSYFTIGNFDGSRVARMATGGGGDLMVYDSATLKEIGQVPYDFASSSYKSAAWSPDGKRIAGVDTFTGGNTLRVYDPYLKEAIWTGLALPDGGAARFFPTGEWTTSDANAEAELVCVVEHSDGDQETLTPAEFRQRVSLRATSPSPDAVRRGP